jgi:galactokinase
MTELRDFFRRHFHRAPSVVVRAPGRLELLGNHTDYNQGLVLSLAVDKYIQIAASPREDGLIELVSSAFPAAEKISVNDLRKNPERPWADYVKGVLLELQKVGIHFSGFSAAIHGTLPMGAGMSSSAALEVATALTIKRLFPFSLGGGAVERPTGRGPNPSEARMSAGEKLALARVCLAAENRFVGVNCGILDQISSLFGRASHAILIDCQNLAVDLVPLADGVSIVICQSGVKHQLVAGEYNELRRRCEAAASAMGLPSLRRADMDMLESWRARLPARDYACARHIIGEIQRVARGETALRAGDFQQFGQYMFQSHESSRDFFGNSAPELDLLVETAREHPACLGARLTGGGFGGATINLVENAGLESFSAHAAATYERLSGRKLEPMLCRVVDGAA